MNSQNKEVKIFITNAGSFDVSSAKELFPDQEVKMIEITDGKISIFRTDGLLRDIRTVLRQEKYAEGDFILIAGNGTISNLVTLVASEISRKINYLIWDHNARNYKLRRVDENYNVKEY